MIHKFSDIPLEGVKGVLIDLDDTLYEFRPANEWALRAVHEAIPFFDTCDEFLAAYLEARRAVVHRLAPQGSCRSRFLAFQYILEQKGVPYAYAIAGNLEKLYWSALFSCIAPNDGALDFLARCLASSIPVCLVSDMTARVQSFKVVQLGIQTYISYVVTSEEVGSEKPSPKMFETALQKLKMQPSDVIMIGDVYEKDIIGAQTLGIKAYQVNLYE